MYSRYDGVKQFNARATQDVNYLDRNVLPEFNFKMNIVI